jgi:hypothetical protein
MFPEYLSPTLQHFALESHSCGEEENYGTHGNP